MHSAAGEVLKFDSYVYYAIFLLFCFLFLFFVFCFVFFFFLGPHSWQMEVPRLGVESKLHLLAYATATATWDLSRVCHLHQSSWQCWILNPLSEARDHTRILMDPSRGC